MQANSSQISDRYNQRILLPLNSEFYDVAKWHVINLCKKRESCGVPAGGVSRIRQTEDRQKSLFVDNLIGHLGTLGVCVYLFGEQKGLDEFTLTRQISDANPLTGDNGSDIYPYKIDVKSSRFWKSQNLNLLVRPKERHEGTAYILTGVSFPGHSNPDTINLDSPPIASQVTLFGWLPESDLPSVVEPTGLFKGAFRVRCTQLHSMRKFDPDNWFEMPF